MKKIMNKINFAIIGIMLSLPAFAAEPALCELLRRLHDVFATLRTLAFVGAAFLMAGWAWDYIKNAGTGKGDFSTDDVKKKGVSLIVGFSLLFLIGVILTAINSVAGKEALGCAILGTW